LPNDRQCRKCFRLMQGRERNELAQGRLYVLVDDDGTAKSGAAVNDPMHDHIDIGELGRQLLPGRFDHIARAEEPKLQTARPGVHYKDPH
jgi:hypothetical protein